MSGRIRAKELSIFFRELYTMINAGVSLYRALELQSQTTVSPRLKRILREISTRIQGGEKFSAQLEKHPVVFSKLIVGLIRAGEATGGLDTMCQRAADYLEKEFHLQETVKRETFYPKILALAIIFIPTVPTLFLQGPGVWFNEILKYVAMAAPIVIGGGVLWCGYKQYLQTLKGKFNIDGAKLRVPLFGKVIQRLSLAKFCRALAALYSAGVGYIQALPMAADACGNEAIADALRSATHHVEAGGKLSEVLSRSRNFHPMVIQMIVTGEETGSLDASLSKVADFLEREAETAIHQMTVALGPILILIGAGLVLAKVVGFYTNLYGSLPME